ncbi:unnamed protein product, partial [Prorocentrum cordatum]
VHGGAAVSVLVLLAVEAAAHMGTPKLAAVASAIPTGMPLALFSRVGSWLRSQAGAGPASGAVADFSDACLRGSIGTVAFAMAMRTVARRGGAWYWMVLAGYAAWLAAWWLVAILFEPSQAEKRDA